MMLRFQGLGVDPEQIRHQFGGAPIGLPEMLRCAKALDLKARVATTNWARLPSTPMPALAALRDGGFLLLGKAGEGQGHRPGARPSATGHYDASRTGSRYGTAASC